MTDKDALKIASWLVVEGGLCEEETEYCNKSCIKCCYEVQKRLRQMAQDMGERTMTNKGDLISREALKKACSEMVRGSNNSDFIPCPSWNDAMELIDNAPTIMPKEFEPLVKAIIDVLPTIVEKIERPQAEKEERFDDDPPMEYFENGGI